MTRHQLRQIAERSGAAERRLAPNDLAIVLVILVCLAVLAARAGC